MACDWIVGTVVAPQPLMVLCGGASLPHKIDWYEHAEGENKMEHSYQ